jgi:hypothetical protein
VQCIHRLGEWPGGNPPAGSLPSQSSSRTGGTSAPGARKRRIEKVTVAHGPKGTGPHILFAARGVEVAK